MWKQGLCPGAAKNQEIPVLRTFDKAVLFSQTATAWIWAPISQGPFRGPVDERPRKQVRRLACHFGVNCVRDDEMFIK